MLSVKDKRKIDKIVRKYADIFKALEAYDLGRYKRSLIVKTSKRIQ